MKNKERLSKLNFGKKSIYAVAVLSAAVIAFFLIRAVDFGRLDVSFYTKISSKIEQDMRIVMVADLHSREFGEGNERLLEKISSLAPDMIAVPGDLTNNGDDDHEVALNFLRGLTDIAPVYYSYGNHEYTDILFNEESSLANDIKNTGVHVVINSFETAEIKGNMIAVGGICSGAANFGDNAERFLKTYVEEEPFKLLLCHHAEVFDECMENYPVDLALCGHAHGGQIRLPAIGGLYAPDQGFFPEYTEGMQNLCGSDVIITRGLGNSSPVIRINNDPEIVVIDLKSY